MTKGVIARPKELLSEIKDTRSEKRSFRGMLIYIRITATEPRGDTMNMKVISKNGKYVAVNLENLNLFTIDENEAEILSLYEKGHKIPYIASELALSETLCRETIKTFCDLPEGICVTSEEPGPVDQLLLMIALDCNMKCSYCYGDGGTYKREKTLMSEKTAFRALDVISPGNIKAVTFFGGEPLLNFPLIKEVVKRVKRANPAMCTIITNGTLMNKEMAAWIKAHNVSVAVSIDGPEEVHDAGRVYPDGKGTHKKVMETVDILERTGIRFAVEATFTKKTLEAGYSAGEILEYLYQFSRAIHITPVGAVLDPEYKLSFQDLIDFYTECIDFTFDKLEGGELINIPDITSFVFRIASPERVIPRLLCPHYAQRVAIFPDGDCYPCCLLAEDEYSCGNVFDPDFSKTFFEKRKDVLSRLCRDRLIQSCWFTPLLARICANDVTSEGQDFSLYADLVKTYAEVVEYFLYKISQVQDWGVFFAMLEEEIAVHVT